jgi:hypothetical protein
MAESVSCPIAPSPPLPPFPLTLLPLSSPLVLASPLTSFLNHVLRISLTVLSFKTRFCNLVRAFCFCFASAHAPLTVVIILCALQRAKDKHGFTSTLAVDTILRSHTRTSTRYAAESET